MDENTAKEEMDRDVEVRYKVAVVGVVICLIIAIALGIGTLVLVLRVDSNTHTIKTIEQKDNARLNKQALRSCERLKIERSKSNDNSKILYILASQIAESSRAAAKQLKASGIYSKREYKARLKIADQYAMQAKKIQWVPQTNCRQAVLHPETYKNPKPRHFNFKVKVPELTARG